jgi:hypothetical protein
MIKLPPEGKPYGILGYFETPADLFHACEQIRDAGYKVWDAHTPFPVHGLERAMGIPPTKLPWLSFTGGALGLLSGISLTYYVAVDYPINISGKAAFSYQAYIPIYFELTVLLTAFFTFFGLWGLCKLPTLFNPIFKHKRWPRAMDDAFFVCIQAEDPKFNSSKTRSFLEKVGAKEVEEVAS